jgi:hypothetical protein
VAAEAGMNWEIAAISTVAVCAFALWWDFWAERR